MSVETMMRIGFVATGLILLARVFWLYARKRLTVDIAMAWEAAGVGLVVVGLVPLFSEWCRLLSAGTGAAVLLSGLIVIWAGLRFSVLLSGLQMKTQELAVQLSLLKAETRQLSEQAEKGEQEDGKN